MIKVEELRIEKPDRVRRTCQRFGIRVNHVNDLRRSLRCTPDDRFFVLLKIAMLGDRSVIKRWDRGKRGKIKKNP